MNNCFVGTLEEVRGSTITLAKNEVDGLRVITLKVKGMIKEKLETNPDIKRGLTVGVIYNENNEVYKFTYLKSN